MAVSPEYPDLTWMPPRSWRNADRTSVQLVVIHDTEGSEGVNSAENGASYDQRRTDGTSCHYFHDQDSTVQCVRTEDIAFTARTQGNLRGIHHELCGKAGQGMIGWADVASVGTIRQAARQVARDCKKWGIPIRRLTPAQVAAGQKGICGHGDVTVAFPNDNGDHTDPGPTFPWASFIRQVQDFANGDDDMAELTPENLTAIARAVWGQKVGRSEVTAHDMLFFTMTSALTALGTKVDAVLGNVIADDAELAQVKAAIAAAQAATVKDVLAGFGAGKQDPAQLASVVRAVVGDQAQAVGRILAGLS